MARIRYWLGMLAMVVFFVGQSPALGSNCNEVVIDGIHAEITEAEFKRTFKKCLQPHSLQGSTGFVKAGIGVYEECYPIPENYAGWRVSYIRFYRGKFDWAVLELIGKGNPKTIEHLIREMMLPKSGWKPDNELPPEYKGYAAAMQCGQVEYQISTGLVPGRSGYADFPKLKIENKSNATPKHILQSLSNNLSPREQEEKFSVSRFYSPTSNYAVAVIEATRTMRLKCVVRDSNGEPIAVDTAKVTPPADEITFIVFGASAASVSCQEIQ